jgi:hypothetical protein
MNKVTEKILLHESGIGIPNLIVTVYDVDFDALPKDAFQSKPAKVVNFWDQLQGDRLGSVLTDGDGAFVLEYDDEEFKEGRPDLLLFVTAPEGAGLDGCSPMLHVSCGIRQNAGRIESYLIRLNSEELKKAGVRLPSIPAQDSTGTNNEPANVIGGLQLRYSRQDKIRELARQFAAERIKQRREMDARIAQTFKRVDKLLSSIPESIRESHQYVPMDADIQQASLASLSKQIEMLHQDDAPIKMSGMAVAAEYMIAGLKQADGSFKPSYSAGEIDPVRFGTTLEPAKGPPTVLVRVETAFEYCERTSNEAVHCLDADGVHDPADENPASDDGMTEGPGVGEAHPLDIPRYVAALLETSFPRSATPLPHELRPNLGAVQRGVNDLVLSGGPADVPAYYDFHHLHIAFDHVWTEAFDQDLVEKLKELCGDILELGGDPLDGDISGIGPWLSPGRGASSLVYSMMSEAERAGQAATSDVPADVIQFIGITKSEWNALTNEQRTAIEYLKESILWIQSCLVTEDSYEFRTRHRLVRAEIQRLIDYARSELSTRGSTFNDRLADLRERIRGDYAFQIYAARPGQRSVNFGILVTYRQKWVPFNYQAGELVKTIPLAPKEVRRYNKRQVIKKSRAEKEVRNNLQSHREDTSETSRAEAEIINKANSKTAFQLGTETGANVGFNTGVVNGSFNGSLNAGFSKETASISEEVKREFREAVFKAAQEYKEERVLEIRTDVTEESEITESGEISNPNDELTVTYLFYELQRRYRVSEQIHRVTPVVFVAQEVPGPHEIETRGLSPTTGY